MRSPFVAVHDITSALESLRIDYAVVGGIANAIWGEPRATIDVDVTVSVNEPDLPATISAITARFRAPAYPRPRSWLSRTAHPRTRARARER